MKRIALTAALTAVLLISMSATHAADKSPATASAKLSTLSTPKVGQYITEQGWGVLDVLQGKDGKRMFRLESVGANGHSCTLDGAIENGIATLKDDPDRVCKVSFAPIASGVAVADASDGMCRSFCGARAGFEGDYRVPPAGCNTGAVRASREKFKKAYDKKQYAEAESHLAPILSRCTITLNLWDDADIRNDLAITYFHLKNKSACLVALTPLAKLAADDDATIMDAFSFAPSDAEGRVSIAKATRTNLKKCNGL
jgi:hypothetical protein